MPFPTSLVMSDQSSVALDPSLYSGVTLQQRNGQAVNYSLYRPLYIDPTGADTNDGQTSLRPVRTLDRLRSLMQDHTCALFGPGTYPTSTGLHLPFVDVMLQKYGWTRATLGDARHDWDVYTEKHQSELLEVCGRDTVADLLPLEQELDQLAKTYGNGTRLRTFQE